MKNILVTGGAGFIGSHFIRHLWMQRKSGKIINLDKLTYAGDLDNLKILERNSNYKFVRGDICDEHLVNWIMTSNEVTHVVNFAAESHVDRSIKNSEDFVRTNIEGTRVLLDAAKKHGIEKFLQIGTDEVYGSLDKDFPSSKEFDGLYPRSPYSASKASADLLALAYYHTHGTPACVTRSSNNYGPWQFPEKVIPLFITNILEGKKVPVYGDGKNIRDWLHVSDNCRGIEFAMEMGIPGEIYNIGGGNELTNLELTEKILRQMGFGDGWREQIEFVEDRKGHDRRYSLNSDKIQRAPFGSSPLMPFEIGLEGTIEWYKENEKWWKPLKEKNDKGKY